MRAGIKSILLILACAVLFGAGFRPRPLPAAAYAATGYSFAGALRAWKESLGPPLPEAVLLDVPVVYQWPEMPNGCEATALTMLLQYYGFAADKLSVDTIISPARTSPTPGFPPTGRTLPPPTQAIRRCSAFTAWPLPWPKEQTVILRNRTARCTRWISAARTVTCSEGASLRDGRRWSGRPSALSPWCTAIIPGGCIQTAPSTIPTKTCTVLWYAATTRTIFISAIRYTARCRSNAAPSCCATRKWNAVQSCSAKRRRMRPLCIREVQGSRKPHCKNKKRKASGCFDGTPPKQPDA